MSRGEPTYPPGAKKLTRTIRNSIEPCPDEGCECWLWTGALDSSGYASAKMKGTVFIVHRYCFEQLVGPIELVCGSCDAIPDLLDLCPLCGGTGLDPDTTIDHLCTGHRNCQNPDHMELVSRSENSRRANHRRHNEGYRRDQD